MNQLCVRYVLSSMYQARMNMHVSRSFMLDSRNRLRSRTRLTIVMFSTPWIMRVIAVFVNVSSADDHACMNVVYAGLATRNSSSEFYHCVIPFRAYGAWRASPVVSCHACDFADYHSLMDFEHLCKVLAINVSRNLTFVYQNKTIFCNSGGCRHCLINACKWTKPPSFFGIWNLHSKNM